MCLGEKIGNHKHGRDNDIGDNSLGRNNGRAVNSFQGEPLPLENPGLMIPDEDCINEYNTITQVLYNHVYIL